MKANCSQPVAVCHFINSPVRGGVEEHVLGLLRHLDRRYFRLILACRPDLLPKLAPDVPSDVSVFPVTINSPRQLSAMLRFVRFLRRERVQILHSHLFYASLFASPLGALARIPVVLETPHIKESWRHGWKSSHAIDRAVGRCVDAYIAVSHANSDYLVSDKRLPKAKVQVIQNGSELERYDPMRPKPAGLKSQLGFGDDDQVLFVPARLEPQKGHSVLLEAMAMLVQKFPTVRLVCAGEGALRPQLEAQIARLKLQDNVRLVGYQEDVREWYALADIGILPSFFEGLPLVAIECLASGRPMVATAVDGTPEIIVDGETGLTVPPGDFGALADAIGLLLRDQSLRTRLACAGRQWVEQHFTFARQVHDTEELYIRLLKERAGTVIQREISAWDRETVAASQSH